MNYTIRPKLKAKLSSCYSLRWKNLSENENNKADTYIYPTSTDILLQKLHIAFHTSVMQVYPNMFAICRRGNKKTWPDEMALSFHEMNSALPFMGRLRI